MKSTLRRSLRCVLGLEASLVFVNIELPTFAHDILVFGPYFRMLPGIVRKVDSDNKG